MKTPFFQINKDVLDENIHTFKDALETIWPNSKLAYSIKTNSLPWLLEYLQAHGVIAEAVSDEEYQLAKLCGYKDHEIVFNGPIKSDDMLKKALEGGSFVNLDSLHELNYLKQQKWENKVNIGVRININPNVFDEKDIGYADDGFRFGYSYESKKAFEVFEFIKNHFPECNIGIHLHCNSITRSLDVYRSISKYAAKIISEYTLPISYIDIGGGFFGGVPGKPDAHDYIKVIKEEFEKVLDISKTTLIAEPGSAIIGSAIDLHTSVIDVKDTIAARIVTTDGSRIHIDPLWAKNRYMYSVTKCDNSERSILSKQIICGYTCMDHDRIMTPEQIEELKIGDKIIYHRVGAYSVTFGGPFIRYFPDVYFKNENNEYTQVRKRISVEDYYKIHS